VTTKTIVADTGEKASGNRADRVPQNAPILGTPFFERLVRRTLWEGLKSSAKPRTEIACRMTEALGRPVTVAMLADFIRSPRKKRGLRFPTAWVPSFCEATGSRDLRRLPLTDEERAALEVGEWLVRHLKNEAQGLMKAEGRQHPRPRKGRK
jgi:hypothetical protein